MVFEEAEILMRKGKVVARRSWADFAVNNGIGLRTLRVGHVGFCRVRQGIWNEMWLAVDRDRTAMDWEVVDAVHPDRQTGNDERVVAGCGNVFTDLDLRVCGNCKSFANEDASGSGWCELWEADRICSEECSRWTLRKKS